MKSFTNHLLLRSVLSAVLVSGLVVACKSDPSSEVGPDGTSEQGVEVCTSAVDGIAEYYDKCDPNGLSSDAANFRKYKDRAVDSCALTLGLPGVSPDLAAAYQDCADALKKSSCNEDIDDLCAKLEDLPGSLAADAACETDEQCASGSCSLSEETGDAVKCGKCAKEIGLGELCGEGAVVCGKGLHCDSGATEQVKCVADQKLGDACEGYCYGDDDLACVGGTCQTPPGKGAACSGFECASGLRCIDSVCADPLTEGATCDPSRDDCGGDLQCDEDTKKCAKQNVVAQKNGQPCNQSDKRCSEGYCGGVTYDSETGDVKDGTCTAYAAEGAACNEESEDPAYCEPYLECENAKCVAPGRQCTY